MYVYRYAKFLLPFLSLFLGISLRASAEVQFSYQNPFTDLLDKSNYDLYQRLTYEERIKLLYEGTLRSLEPKLEQIGILKCAFYPSREQLTTAPQILYKDGKEKCYFSYRENPAWLTLLVMNESVFSEIDRLRIEVSRLESEKARISTLVENEKQTVTKKKPRKGEKASAKSPDQIDLERVSAELAHAMKELSRKESQVVTINRRKRLVVDDNGGRFFVYLERTRRKIDKILNDWTVRR